MLKYPNTNCVRAAVPARGDLLKHSLSLGGWQWDVASRERAVP